MLGAIPAVALVVIFSGCEKEAPKALPPPVVEVMSVQPQDIPIPITWVGTTVGDVDAQIRAQVEGYLQAQIYRNGSAVKKGDLMFQIDPRPFEAQLGQAEGTFAEADARLKRDFLNAKRATELYEKKVISTEEFDDTTQQYMASKAGAATAKAAVDSARLNLEFTQITAPIDGVASIATAQVGDLVGPSSGVLATVTGIDPIKVEFAMAEQEYLSYIQQFFEHPELSPLNKPNREGPVLTLKLSDGSDYIHPGRMVAINNVVGVNTGAMIAEGLFPNPGNLLRAGQYGLVTATVRKAENALAVPDKAIIDMQGMKQLAVVGKDNKINLQTVQTGPQVGGQTIIKDGLNAGDTVVVTGVQKAKQGEVVDPRPVASPTPSPTPPEASGEPAPTPAPSPVAAN